MISCPLIWGTDRCKRHPCWENCTVFVAMRLNQEFSCLSDCPTMTGREISFLLSHAKIFLHLPCDSNHPCRDGTTAFWCGPATIWIRIKLHRYGRWKQWGLLAVMLWWNVALSTIWKLRCSWKTEKQKIFNCTKYLFVLRFSKDHTIAIADNCPKQQWEAFSWPLWFFTFPFRMVGWSLAESVLRLVQRKGVWRARHAQTTVVVRGMIILRLRITISCWKGMISVWVWNVWRCELSRCSLSVSSTPVWTILSILEWC